METNLPRMELDLGHIEGRESFSWAERFEIETPEGEKASCDAAVKADVTRTGNRYLLEAGIECSINVPCSRCLEPFDYVMETGFRLVLERGEKIEVAEGEEEDDFVLISQEEEYDFDIFPRVREAILLELPIKYLCSEDCAGICPGCGAALNREECRCPAPEGDPRWGALDRIVKKRKED